MEFVFCDGLLTLKTFLQSAKLLPGSSTKKHILTQHGIAVDGPLSDQLLCLYASRDDVPSVIKLLKNDIKGARHREVSAVQALQDVMIDSIPLVPYKLIELVLDESHTSTCHPPGTYSALISPRYVYSVAKMVPQPQLSAIVEGGKRIMQALEQIHSKGFVHMDVKVSQCSVLHFFVYLLCFFMFIMPGCQYLCRLQWKVVVG